jgi:hypothetical protein
MYIEAIWWEQPCSGTQAEGAGIRDRLREGSTHSQGVLFVKQKICRDEMWLGDGQPSFRA